MEDILIQKVTAKAQIRIGGDPRPHLDEARDTYKDLVKAIKSTRRQNRGPELGLAVGYGVSYGYDWSGE